MSLEDAGFEDIELSATDVGNDLDWRSLTKSQVRNNIVAHAGKGAIILQHGGGGKGSNLQGTIQALPEVITIMRKRGYIFVTVPHMLQVSKNK